MCGEGIPVFESAWMWLFSAPTDAQGPPELGQGNTASSAFSPLVHLNTVNRELSSPQDQAEKLGPREGILLLPITPLSLHPATRLPVHLREAPNPCLRAPLPTLLSRPGMGSSGTCWDIQELRGCGEKGKPTPRGCGLVPPRPASQGSSGP